MLSFWEKNSFLQYDYIIVGSGLMGLHIAYELIEKEPMAKISILERGVFPSGASTKNAGFACFGSLTEIISDFNLNGVAQTVEILKERFEGIELLCDRLGKENIGFKEYGGYELIFEKDLSALEQMEEVNEILFPIFKKNVFELCNDKISVFGFDANVVKALVFNSLEGQIDTGKMMEAFLKLVTSKGVQILTGCEVCSVSDTLEGGVAVVENKLLKENIEFKAKKIFICTNALISNLTTIDSIRPGRGQVLITKPISNLPFKGVFHFDAGYYYFRNFESRVIFGGGRNIDFEKEESPDFEYNEQIMDVLKNMLGSVILPGFQVEIEDEWTGIMGFTSDKKSLVVNQSKNVLIAMSCNGMGVALTGVIAKKALSLLD